MRHLRPFAALIALAIIGAACSGPAASSGAGQSEGAGASQPAASQPAASSGGGGGGGGTGANGSLHYEITGDVTKSGDLDFFASGGLSQFNSGGWVAYFNNTDSSVVIQISSIPSAESAGYGDGETTIVGAVSDCTFDFSENDANGLKGTIDCPNPTAFKSASAAQVHVHFRATVDTHT